MASNDEINDQLRQKAHAARIRAQREVQRQAAREGQSLSRRQADQVLREQLMENFRAAQPDVARTELIQAQVKQIVASEMAKFRINGPGVTGSGFSWVISPFRDTPQEATPENDDNSGGGSGGNIEFPPGEGVYADSIGGGPVDLIVDSGGELTDTISVKSLADGDGILLDDSSIAGQVKIEVALSTVYDKAIALSFASGTIYAEWFYDNAAADGISVVKEIHATDGAVFYPLENDGTKGIAIQIVEEKIRFEAKAANVGGHAEVYKELHADEGLRFRTLKEGTAIAITENADDIEIDLDDMGATTGDVITFNGTEWAPAEPEAATIAVQEDGTPIVAEATTLNFDVDADGHGFEITDSGSGVAKVEPKNVYIIAFASTTEGGTYAPKIVKVMGVIVDDPSATYVQEPETCDPDGTITTIGTFEEAP